MKTGRPDANHTFCPTTAVETMSSPPGPDPPGLTAAWTPSEPLPAAAATAAARLLLALLVPNQVQVNDSIITKIFHK
jgi:hypothetical protein